MTRVLFLSLIALTALQAAATKPAPATVTQKAGDQSNDIQVMVHAYNVDVLLYTIPGQGTQPQPLKTEQILAVDYDRPKSPDYFRAVGYQDSGRWDSAAQYFAKTAELALYDWVRIDSLYRLAYCQYRGKKYDAALESIERLLKTYPKSVRVPEALALKGDVLVAAGKEAAGLKVYDELASRAKGYGPRTGAQARALAALGKAEVYGAKQDHGKAISALQAAQRSLDAREFPSEYARVSLQLAQAQADGGKQGDALEAFAALMYQPVAAELQGRAHLGRAKIFLAQGKKIQAFDSAVYAMLRGGSDPSVSGPARQMARKLGTELSKDQSLSEEDRKQYLSYVSKL